MLGTWQAIARLTTESDYQRILREYQTRDRDSASSTAVTVAPMLTPHAGGLQVAGAL